MKMLAKHFLLLSKLSINGMTETRICRRKAPKTKIWTKPLFSRSVWWWMMTTFTRKCWKSPSIKEIHTRCWAHKRMSFLTWIRNMMIIYTTTKISINSYFQISCPWTIKTTIQLPKQCLEAKMMTMVFFMELICLWPKSIWWKGKS